LFTSSPQPKAAVIFRNRCAGATRLGDGAHLPIEKSARESRLSNDPRIEGKVRDIPGPSIGRYGPRLSLAAGLPERQTQGD
jgi:hypothetical protein